MLPLNTLMVHRIPARRRLAEPTAPLRGRLQPKLAKQGPTIIIIIIIINITILSNILHHLLAMTRESASMTKVAVAQAAFWVLLLL
jgi:hypothetical protein